MSGGFQVPEGKYTRTMLARECHVSLSTIKRMEKEGVIEPRKREPHGSLKVALYDQRDVERVNGLKPERRPGRKPATTVEPSAQPTGRLHRVKPYRTTAQRQRRGK